MKRKRSRIVSLGAWGVAVAALGLVAGGAGVSTQQPASASDILYLLPTWAGLASSTTADVQAEIGDVRRRIGPEGLHVRLGFSGFVFITMNDTAVDVNDQDAVRASLGNSFDVIDTYIQHGLAGGFPVGLCVLTPIRDRYDPVQQETERVDVRSMQWLADNTVARGWWSHSRYARHARALQEAHIRAFGRLLANRMARYPDTLVSAAGDGEVELAYVEDAGTGGLSTNYADYSPFAVAEFRDWIRHCGLYAPGQPYAGQGYEHGARYASDLTPAEDTNGDGHTLNGDFGVAFQTWRLLHFDWELGDRPGADDVGAIPLAETLQPTFERMPSAVDGGFDPPRIPVPDQTDPWWNLWVLFKQTLLQHHNTDFARWVTTSADPETGATVPPERWFSYQMPADYAFNGSPAFPNERFLTSMSAWWTADIAPFGSLGITAFNLDWTITQPPVGITYTLRRVAPLIAERGRRWGIVEWHPGVLAKGGVSPNLAIYREEMAVIERHRPALLQPFMWGDPVSRVQDTGFETALREMVARINDPLPPRLTPAVTSVLMATDGHASTPGVRVQVDQSGWVRAAWNATTDTSWLAATPASALGAAVVDLSVTEVAASLPPGTHAARVTLAGSSGLPAATTIDVTVNVIPPAATRAPFGQIDRPVQGARVQGTVGITGWVLDDIGVASVKVYRECVPSDPQTACASVAGERGVLLGEAGLQEGMRPDVAAVFASWPLASRAGWGYPLDTMRLRSLAAVGGASGPGTIRVFAVAFDQEGKSTLLGRATDDHTPTTLALPAPR